MVNFRERQMWQQNREPKREISLHVYEQHPLVDYGVARNAYLQTTVGDRASRINHLWMAIQPERQ